MAHWKSAKANHAGKKRKRPNYAFLGSPKSGPTGPGRHERQIHQRTKQLRTQRDSSAIPSIQICLSCEKRSDCFGSASHGTLRLSQMPEKRRTVSGETLVLRWIPSFSPSPPFRPRVPPPEWTPAVITETGEAAPSSGPPQRPYFRSAYVEQSENACRDTLLIVPVLMDLCETHGSTVNLYLLF